LKTKSQQFISDISHGANVDDGFLRYYFGWKMPFIPSH